MIASKCGMVRNINVTVSDGQYDRLEDVKGDRSWRAAMLEEFGVREAPGGVEA